MGKRKGFTLIEIVIAVMVIGVLASTALVAYQNIKRRNQYRAMRAGVHALTDAVKGYFYTLQAYCVTGNTGLTNDAYGTKLVDDNFCRYAVILAAGVPRVQVQYFRGGCGSGAMTGFYTFNISGDQISCAGADCMT